MLVKTVKICNVCKIIPPIEVFDGAGVRLRKFIASPHLNHLDPFLLLDEFKSDDQNDYVAGFPPHPHRGFQTLTYMISVKFKHEDSTGSAGKLTPGRLQWMNAGSEVIHSETPLMKDGLLWGYQLWLNLPTKEKMSNPFYYNFNAIELNENNAKINILSGTLNKIKPKNWTIYPIIYLDIRLTRENNFKNVFCLVPEGKIKFPVEEEVKQNQLAILTRGNLIQFAALENSVESIARWEPSVMKKKKSFKQLKIIKFTIFKNKKWRKLC